MKASELIEVLQADPEATVQVGYEEFHDGGEDGTGWSEDEIGCVYAVFKNSDGFVIASEFYMHGERIWPRDLD